MNTNSWGKSYINAIFLEDISLIEAKYTSNIIYLFLGWVGVTVGVIGFIMQQQIAASAIILGIVFFVSMDIF